MKDLIQDEKKICASFGPINQVHKKTKEQNQNQTKSLNTLLQLRLSLL